MNRFTLDFSRRSIVYRSLYKQMQLKTQLYQQLMVSFCPVCFCRDRSDTAVVGSSRPVCKTNPKSTLSPPPLTSLPLPLFLALVTFLENILSTMIELCVSSVHCVLATFVLRSLPLYVIRCLFGRVSSGNHSLLSLLFLSKNPGFLF